MMTGYQKGVSLIICTYNGAHLLVETIKYILEQEVPSEIDWEFLLIDNASNDNTQEVVRNLWDINIPCRIIYEGEKGLINARNRGIKEAKYEYISFIDDDNWIDKNWIGTIYDIFTKHPGIGVCGGQIEGAYEGEPPGWFEKVKESFAIGKQGEMSGDVTESRGFIWGAGISLRKSAFESVREAGFKPILTGRKGNILLAGEDTEICYIMRLAGWRLWYDERLKMKHFITSRRMQWEYLINMYSGFGYSHAVFEIYYLFLLNKRYNYSRLWIKSFAEFVYYTGWRGFHLFSKMDGNPERLRFQLYYTKYHFTSGNRILFREYYHQINEYKTNIKALPNPQVEPPGNHLVSIVTVCLNNRTGLEKTLKSVISQEYTDHELIVIDGGSRDGSLDIIEKYRQSISAWVSEPDKGPYDAMNKGAEMAKGNWIIFLNSGDMFYEPTSLKKMMQYLPDNNADAIYGDNLVDYHDFLVYRKASPYREIWRGMIFSHQALLLKTSLITANLFDLRLSKIADYDQVLRCLKDPERVYYAPVPFVICDAFGISAKGQAGTIRAYYRCSRRFHNMSAGRKLYFIRRYILSLVIDIAKFFIPEQIYYRITGLLKKKHAFPGK